MAFDPDGPFGIDEDLEQIDAVRPAAGERASRPPQSRQLASSQALPGPEARPETPGLHLHQDEHARIGDHQVDLAPARQEPTREHAASLPAEVTCREALAGHGKGRILRTREAQTEPRSEVSERRAGER